MLKFNMKFIKNTHLEKQINYLENVTDKLGTPLDKKIIVLVSILNLHSFTTTGSCAGHSDGRTPWVDICSKAAVEQYQKPDGFTKNISVSKRISLENLREGKRLQDLLDEFYQKKNLDRKVMLTIEPIGNNGLGGIRLAPSDISASRYEKHRERLNRYRSELDDFANFLIEKFNHENN